MQLKLVNAIAKCVEARKMPKEHEHSAYRFHTDLFLSGLKRIIIVSLKIHSFQFCLIASHL